MPLLRTGFIRLSQKMLEDQLRDNFVAMHRNEVQRNAKQREDMQRTSM